MVKRPDSFDLAGLQDIREGIISNEALLDNLRDGSAIVLKGRTRFVAVGKGLAVKVNTSIGLNSEGELQQELGKIKAISELDYKPDTMMDLSTRRISSPLYKHIIETVGCPVGTLPHYLCYDPTRGIDPNDMLHEAEAQAKDGVSFMTLHVTPRRTIYEKAKKMRLTPCTSRGGGIVIHDMYINKREESVISLLFDEILSILAEYNVALSVGTAFRPANVIDAMDEVHQAEIEIQGEYIRRARTANVQVMMEGIGHATFDKIETYTHMVKRKYGIPVMPLGPIPTDAAVGFDHVANAIGAAFVAYLGGADIINSITREEHTGGIPKVDSIIEGLRAARVAAHAVNICRFGDIPKKDFGAAKKRADSYTCVIEGDLFSQSAKARFSMGCDRCGPECPLIVNYKLREKATQESGRDARDENKTTRI